MQNHFEIVLTDDGSQTILNKKRNTTYHSTKGAVTESYHVFIEAGLKYLAAKGIRRMKILEMGFGTGLNAFLTFLAARDLDIEVEYNGIEANPLPLSITEKLTYPEFLNIAGEDNIFRQLHSTSGITGGRFTQNILRGKVEDLAIPSRNTLVYYDAFGPEDQSELWELDILSRIVSSMAPDGVLVTYCAQGQFKRNLKHLGCEVESLPGPPGKREMVRATLRKTRDR
jgi:tRNA U34 5-methylaminomethyl-2-thiouridine-forming methyltransferase MnmC